MQRSQRQFLVPTGFLRPLKIPRVYGRPSFLQDPTPRSHNSSHTTLHGPILHTHSFIRHNSTRHNSTCNNSTHHNSTRHSPTLYNLTLHNSISQNLTRHNSTRHNSIQLQLDTTQFYTTTTRHGITFHDHNSTQTIWL